MYVTILFYQMKSDRFNNNNNNNNDFLALNTTITKEIDMFKVGPGGYISLAVFELFPCL